MTHLRLVPPGDAPAPDYVEHQGRPVTWRPWERPKPMAHVTLVCESCGCGDWLWVAAGLVGPLPDDRFQFVERAFARDGREYGVERDVPAWPVFELFAYHCSACGETTVYDMGRSGAEWVEIDIDRPALW
ncbi:hypothetical protein ACGFNU_21530 [Spirillospora sp. NPDC048911]|uniref:hypothetical protein n=1 Tax=Spirillospora sp. NPDC048911 TaxID=3364527 RepID=UPI00371B1959